MSLAINLSQCAIVSSVKKKVNLPKNDLPHGGTVCLPLEAASESEKFGSSTTESIFCLGLALKWVN